jgi:hypothetical protein
VFSHWLMEGNSHAELSFTCPKHRQERLKSVESGAVHTDMMLKCSNFLFEAQTKNFLIRELRGGDESDAIKDLLSRNEIFSSTLCVESSIHKA